MPPYPQGHSSRPVGARVRNHGTPIARGGGRAFVLRARVTQRAGSGRQHEKWERLRLAAGLQDGRHA